MTAKQSKNTGYDRGPGSTEVRPVFGARRYRQISSRVGQPRPTTRQLRRRSSPPQNAGLGDTAPYDYDGRLIRLSGAGRVDSS